MKKTLIFTLLALPFFSCSTDKPADEYIKGVNATATIVAEEIEFQIRENPASFYCDDQTVPTNDFDIVFQQPTEIPLTISFFIKKDLNRPESFLAPEISAVSIPVGTRVKTVYSSCDLPYLLDCEVNGSMSGTFYIGVTEVNGNTSNYNYSSDDIISILATRSCSGIGTGPGDGGTGGGW